MSPPGVQTPEKALEDLKAARRELRNVTNNYRVAQAEAERLEREGERAQVRVKRAESTLSLAVSESVANEPADPS